MIQYSDKSETQKSDNGEWFWGWLDMKTTLRAIFENHYKAKKSIEL